MHCTAARLLWVWLDVGPCSVPSWSRAWVPTPKIGRNLLKYPEHEQACLPRDGIPSALSSLPDGGIDSMDQCCPCFPLSFGAHIPTGAPGRAPAGTLRMTKGFDGGQSPEPARRGWM